MAWLSRSDPDEGQVGRAPAFAQRHFWQNTGTLITSVLVLGLALAGALLWRRAQRPRMYAWFTLAAAVWGLRNLNFVLTDNPWDNLWWNRASLAGAAVFVGLFALFTQDYSRWMPRCSAGRRRRGRWRWPAPST